MATAARAVIAAGRVSAVCCNVRSSVGGMACVGGGTAVRLDGADGMMAVVSNADGRGPGRAPRMVGSFGTAENVAAASASGVEGNAVGGWATVRSSGGGAAIAHLGLCRAIETITLWQTAARCTTLRS